MLWYTEYGHPVRKPRSLQSRKSTPNPKFLGTAEAYRQYRLKFLDLFALCLHWVSVVRAMVVFCLVKDLFSICSLGHCVQVTDSMTLDRYATVFCR